MGLRERNAERTRRRITEAAVTAFVEQGYDATTMEQIAKAAEVGSSTLYRYFPSKELLVLAPFAEVLDHARFLRARPADEPPAEALGGALLDLADELADPDRRITEIRRIIDVSAVPRARLWDVVLGSRAEYEAALAERMGVDPSAPAVRISIGLALDVFYRVDEEWRRGGGEDYPSLLREALTSLDTAELVVPSLPAALAGRCRAGTRSRS